MPAYFSPASLRFLRSLRRHNDRDWFNPRKAIFLDEIHAPMVRLCDDLNAAFERFAPEHAQPSRKAMMRIYENLRFHGDRPPYKTQLGVWWGGRRVARTSGAGFYLHLDATGIRVAAGCFRPSREQLAALRAAIARDPAALRTALNAPRLRRWLPECSCAPLARAPKGFLPDHSAMDLLRCTQWGRSATLPEEVAVGDRLLSQMVRRFEAAAPLVAWLDRACGGFRAPRVDEMFVTSKLI